MTKVWGEITMAFVRVSIFPGIGNFAVPRFDSNFDCFVKARILNESVKETRERDLLRLVKGNNRGKRKRDRTERKRKMKKKK